MCPHTTIYYYICVLRWCLLGSLPYVSAYYYMSVHVSSHYYIPLYMCAQVVLAGLFGVVWGQQQSVVDRIGSVVMTSINTSMIALVRSVCVRERECVCV
jgi:hypothetical protein